MKFDQIKLTGSESITLFDLKQPRSTPFTARTIDGLGPTDVDVTLAQTTQGSGIYVGRREQLREITLNLYLNPNYNIGQTPETLREMIYLLRPVNEDQSLDFCLFRDGFEVAVTPVYVKKIDLAPFNKENTLQLVLASTSEFFRLRNPVELPDPQFDHLEPAFNNQGTVQTGFNVKLQFNSTFTSFGLHRGANEATMMFKDPIGSDPIFNSGDILEIDTSIGQRGAWLTSQGVQKSALAYMTPESPWFSLYPGPNHFRVSLEDPPNFTWLSFSHQPKYRGV